MHKWSDILFENVRCQPDTKSYQKNYKNLCNIFICKLRMINYSVFEDKCSWVKGIPENLHPANTFIRMVHMRMHIHTNIQIHIMYYPLSMLLSLHAVLICFLLVLNTFAQFGTQHIPLHF